MKLIPSLKKMSLQVVHVTVECKVEYKPRGRYVAAYLQRLFRVKGKDTLVVWSLAAGALSKL